MKPGRNEECPCGSGKKFKRCCISKPLIPYIGNATKSADPLPVKTAPTSFFFKHPKDKLLATNTGELFHPVRLYYKMFSKEKIQDVFNGLQCMKYDKIYDRWVWLYKDEAINLEFQKKYSDIPANMHPIIIGSFFSKTDNEMFLDVRSIERAEKAAIFFDKHIPRSAAEFTEVAITNRFVHPSNRQEIFNFDFLFETHKAISNPEKDMNELIDRLGQIENIDERSVLGAEFIFNKLKEKFPDIERFPSHFYEDGIDILSMKLKLSQTVAMQRFNGNENVSPFDVFVKTIP